MHIKRGNPYDVVGILYGYATSTLEVPRGPKDHINISIPHPGPKAQDKGDPRIVVYRTLVYILHAL